MLDGDEVASYTIKIAYSAEGETEEEEDEVTMEKDRKSGEWRVAAQCTVSVYRLSDFVFVRRQLHCPQGVKTVFAICLFLM